MLHQRQNNRNWRLMQGNKWPPTCRTSKAFHSDRAMKKLLAADPNDEGHWEQRRIVQKCVKKCRWLQVLLNRLSVLCAHRNGRGHWNAQIYSQFNRSAVGTTTVHRYSFHETKTWGQLENYQTCKKLLFWRHGYGRLNTHFKEVHSKKFSVA